LGFGCSKIAKNLVISLIHSLASSRAAARRVAIHGLARD
jgi:hypothetical protein